MQHVLPPRPGGVTAALQAAPHADVVFVAHTGLEHLSTVRDVWRGLPMNKTLFLRWWFVPAAEVPHDEAELTRSIMPWPALNLTEPTDQTRYRYDWTSPSLVSQHDANVVYMGGNVLFRTADRGHTWAPISPDLTRNDRSTQGVGGAPFTNEGAGGEVYGAIVTIAESPHDASTLYVGTDDGLVQLGVRIPVEVSHRVTLPVPLRDPTGASTCRSDAGSP